MKRKLFLETFLRAFGAKDIVWTYSDLDKICGTVIYDLTVLDERQEFCWTMREESTPPDEVRHLVEYLIESSLIEADRIVKPLAEINYSYPTDKVNVIRQLLDVKVDMMDNGQPTDFYFLHEWKLR